MGGTPDVAQDLGVGQDLVAVAGEQAEQRVLLGGKTVLGAIADDEPTRQVDGK